eukprot:TRINITY_DN11427_c0_g2_i2.p5 TRINITY_DN11427_c0_g2~~TRINITY_DN11427_c0_g2_i2.p5  ORF type:complete len:120 (-),score=19.40 TRINITY_DN11427_c0_g2_i2:3258-3617(-)
MPRQSDTARLVDLPGLRLDFVQGDVHSILLHQCGYTLLTSRRFIGLTESLIHRSHSGQIRRCIREHFDICRDGSVKINLSAFQARLSLIQLVALKVEKAEHRETIATLPDVMAAAGKGG